MKSTRLFFLATFGTIAATTAAAQWNDFEGAVFYEHADYGGSTLTLYPGEGIADLSLYNESFWDSWNDEISSVAVYGEVIVYLYSDVNYRGEYITLTSHLDSFLYGGYPGWNDRASSIYVDYYYPEGWMYDTSLLSWVYWEGDWFYHDNGLGWLYGGYWDRTAGTGWVYDYALGWLYTSYASYPWLNSWNYGHLMFLEGTYAPRWFYQTGYGWFSS
jgi:hypothetical protein